MNQSKRKKTSCPKNYMFTEESVSEIVGCSVSYVKKIRTADRMPKTVIARMIMLVDELGVDTREKLHETLKSM